MAQDYEGRILEKNNKGQYCQDIARIILLKTHKKCWDAGDGVCAGVPLSVKNRNATKTNKQHVNSTFKHIITEKKKARKAGPIKAGGKGMQKKGSSRKESSDDAD